MKTIFALLALMLATGAISVSIAHPQQAAVCNGNGC
jgi:hypothetical protein